MRNIKPVTREQFFEENRGKYSCEAFAEKVYLMIHTCYFKEGIKSKVAMRENWKREFHSELSDESFEYMLVNAPIMLRQVIIEETKKGQEITSSSYLRKTILAFEFDCWLVKRFAGGKSLELAVFERYIREKYGKFLDGKLKSLKEFDLAHLEQFEGIAKGLLPYTKEICSFCQLILKNNRMRIEYENPNAEITDDYGKFSVPAPAPIAAANPEQGISRELEIILKEKEERIEKLENDIREFKRQRDEAREYSANQYDRGIKDLFGALNDVRYGKVIDYLYGLLKDEQTDETLASYLDNLFMAFEDMEVEPILEKLPAVKVETMLKEYNLEFDKSKFDEKKVRLKYSGWKYKDIPMEKPTLTQED